MLPLGWLGKGFGHEWYTNFTEDEQITMMTLWCIFRSPLMLGCELTKLDEKTTRLITNDKVLRLLKESEGARQVERDASHAVWFSRDTKEKAYYLAMFNFTGEKQELTVTMDKLGIENIAAMEELWSGNIIPVTGNEIKAKTASHGAVLIKIELSGF